MARSHLLNFFVNISIIVNGKLSVSVFKFFLDYIEISIYHHVS